MNRPIPVLMYHQIDAPPSRGTPLRGLVVAPHSFAWQMAMLKCLGYKGLSMRDLEPYLDGRQSGKVVGVTFDDGYLNNLVNALPILQRHGHTATCYAVSSLIGQTNRWDEGIVASKPLMGRDHWQQWIAAGMDVGSHTQHHIDLRQSSDELALQEMKDSKQALEQSLGVPVHHFCYPYGRLETKHVEMARQAGYTTATTMDRGRVWPETDRHRMPRVMVACATNPWQFYLKVATGYEDRRS
jgi:peptidoglycan/xylan/chitin deacetylase (PgdA/CDA1 family)